MKLSVKCSNALSYIKIGFKNPVRCCDIVVNSGMCIRPTWAFSTRW